MFKYLIASTVAVFLGFAAYVFYYIGGYKSANFEFGQQPKTTVLYKEHVGPYHKINATIQDVETWAKNNQFKCELSYGEYLDNPGLVEEARLKSQGGCIILDSEFNELEKISQTGLPENFKFKTIPARDVLIAKFDGSPAIGPWKVYDELPDLLKSARKHLNGPTMEVYQITGKNAMNTIYYFPTAKDEGQ